MTDQPDTIRLDLPGTYKYLNVLGACIETMLNRFKLIDQDRTTYGIQLATHECCTNIVKHAYHEISGRINITLKMQTESNIFTIDLYDTGIPFKQKISEEPIQPEPKLKGYGLFLINQVMDSVSYTANSGKNHWRLSKKISIESE